MTHPVIVILAAIKLLRQERYTSSHHVSHVLQIYDTKRAEKDNNNNTSVTSPGTVIRVSTVQQILNFRLISGPARPSNLETQGGSAVTVANVSLQLEIRSTPDPADYASVKLLLMNNTTTCLTVITILRNHRVHTKLINTYLC